MKFKLPKHWGWFALGLVVFCVIAADVTTTMFDTSYFTTSDTSVTLKGSLTNWAKLATNQVGGGGFAGAVSNNVASAGLLAVDASKTNGIAANFGHVTNALGYIPSPLDQTSINLSGTDVDLSLTNRWFSKLLGADTTFTFSNIPEGARWYLILTNGASWTATWPAVSWLSGGAPVMDTGAGTVNAFVFFQQGGVTFGDVSQKANANLNTLAALASVSSLASLSTNTFSGTGKVVLESAAGGTNWGSIGITIDGGGAVITSGVKGYVSIPYDCTIYSATMLADQVGSAVVDLWKTNYANFPPLVAQSIVSATPPTITTTNKMTDTTLSGWITNVTAGDVLAFNVNATPSAITRLTLVLKVLK